MPQDWPEPQDGVMTPALMNGQSFVVQCDATDAEMRQFLKKYKIGTERRCHVIDDQSNIAMVEAGLGISIMPQMLLRDCKAAVKVYPIEPEEYRVVGLAVQRPASMAPAVEQMFHHIVDYCRQLELPCDLFSITQSAGAGNTGRFCIKQKTFAAGAKVSARRCFTLPEISGIMKGRTEQNAKGRGFYGDCGVRFQPAAAEQVAQRIKDYILEEKLKSGDKLPTETALAREMGVARSTVREAIKRLESQNILTVRHGAGSFVTTSPAWRMTRWGWISLRTRSVWPSTCWRCVTSSSRPLPRWRRAMPPRRTSPRWNRCTTSWNTTSCMGRTIWTRI